MLGNAVLLRELIRNLVDNALQYTPAGGTVTVRVIDDPFGQVVVLQVEDSGPGIAAAEREQVFQPFYRSLGTNVDGSGLGLAIVREIAEQHGAEVTLADADRGRAEGPASSVGAWGRLFTVRFAPRPCTPAVERRRIHRFDGGRSHAVPALAPRSGAEEAAAISSGPGAGSSRSTSGCRARGRA